MKKPTKSEIKKSLNYSIKDSAADAAKNGITDNYRIPFALMMGATNEMIGFITALPDLFGMFAQMLSRRLIKETGSKKKRVSG